MIEDLIPVSVLVVVPDMGQCCRFSVDRHNSYARCEHRGSRGCSPELEL